MRPCRDSRFQNVTSYFLWDNIGKMCFLIFKQTGKLLDGTGQFPIYSQSIYPSPKDEVWFKVDKTCCVFVWKRESFKNSLPEVQNTFFW